MILFAFSTIISWSYYGEQGAVFLFGEKSLIPYRYVYICFIVVGAVWKLAPVLNLSDAFFALLVIPNLIANFMLSGRLKKELKIYEADIR